MQRFIYQNGRVRLLRDKMKSRSFPNRKTCRKPPADANRHLQIMICCTSPYDLCIKMDVSDSPATKCNLGVFQAEKLEETTGGRAPGRQRKMSHFPHNPTFCIQKRSIHTHKPNRIQDTIETRRRHPPGVAQSRPSRPRSAGPPRSLMQLYCF